MGFLIGLLTVVMVLDCVVLIFLVLIQLPKKEAGAGLAFGAGATDALFGAGSGTVLTKVTKYTAGVFFALAVILAVLQRNYHNRSTTEFERQLQKAPEAAAPGVPGKTAAPAPSPSAAPAITPNTGTNLLSTPAEATNVPAPANNPTSAPPATK